MDLHLFVIISTLYILGFFMPFIFQILIEKYYNKNKSLCLNYFKKYKFIRNFILFFRKKHLEKSLPNACFGMGIVSVILSNITMILFSDTLQNQLYSLFIGLWAPTLIIIGIYLKKK